MSPVSTNNDMSRVIINEMLRTLNQSIDMNSIGYVIKFNITSFMYFG